MDNSNPRAPATHVTKSLTALLVSVSPKLWSMNMMPAFHIDVNEAEGKSFECALDALLRTTNESPVW